MPNTSLLDYNINPILSTQDNMQTRGLDPSARDPHDYLKMVSKIFNAYKESPYYRSTVSYIYGFNINYTYIDKIDSSYSLKLEDQLKYLDINKKYHMFEIEPGACFIDDQFVEFNKSTVFLFEHDETNELANNILLTEVEDYINPAYTGQPIKLFKGLKYRIIIDYKWVKQVPAQIARIKFIVDHLDNEDTIETEGNYDSNNYPYLKIGQFRVDNFGNIIKNIPETLSNTYIDEQFLLDNQLVIVDNTNSGGNLEYHKRGIDPQYLSKLYVDNYKSLFKNIQTQIYTVFNEMRLNQSLFTVITEIEEYDDNLKKWIKRWEDTKIQIGLKSGTFVYLDPIDKTYKPAEASRQKFDKVTGLYLYDKVNNQHIIFFNGLIDLDPDRVLENNYSMLSNYNNRYGLEPKHPLLNLESGQYYFLEDDQSYFENSILEYNLENYINWNTSGFISTRQYPGAVKVGYAFTRSKFLLNIDHSNEIDWMNAVNLFGNHEKFKTIYTATKNYYTAETLNELYNTERSLLNIQISDADNYLGNTINNIYNTSYVKDLTIGLNLPTNNYQENDVLKFYKFISNIFLTQYVNNFKPVSNSFSYDNTRIINFDDFLSFKNEIKDKLELNILNDYNNDINLLTEEDYTKFVNIFNDWIMDPTIRSQFKLGSTTLNASSDILNILYNFGMKLVSILDNTIIQIKLLKNTSYTSLLNNELDLITKKRLYELGDNPDIIDVFEDTSKNILMDLGIKYTDENYQLISYDINEESLNGSHTASVTAMQTNIDNFKNSYNLFKDSEKLYFKLLQDIRYILNHLKLNQSWNNILFLYFNDIKNKGNIQVGVLNNEIANNINLKSILSSKINLTNDSNSLLSLDIFYLNNYERKRYNYTYCIDRLKFELNEQKNIKNDIDKSKVNISALYANNADEYTKKLEEYNLSRLELQLKTNYSNISNYIEEINNILDSFGKIKLPINITLETITIDSELYNSKPNDYKFGVDFGPIGTLNEKILVNNGFNIYCNNLYKKLKNGEISTILAKRIIPEIYQLSVNSYGFSTDDFKMENFKPLSFSGNVNHNSPTTDHPYFYINIEGNKHLVVKLQKLINDNQIVFYKFFRLDDYQTITDYNLPNIVFDEVSKIIVQHQDKDIIEIDDRFFVYSQNLSNFYELKPKQLNNEEISRFVKESRVKHLDDELKIASTTKFLDYFINKEEINNTATIMNNYLDILNNIDFGENNTQVVITLPIIDIKYSLLINNVSSNYNNINTNLLYYNELANILSMTYSKQNLDNIDITDSQLLKYQLTSSFRNEPIEIRNHKLVTLMGLYKTIILSEISKIQNEIKKYRDINILGLIELQNNIN